MGASSLVEVVMSIAIIAVVAGGLVGALSYGFFVMELARENQRATQIMLERTEAIRLYNWTEINTPGFVPATFTDVYDPQGGTNYQGVVYNGQVTIGNVPFNTSYSQYMVQLTLTLNWATKSINHTRSLTTYIAKDGIQNYVY